MDGWMDGEIGEIGEIGEMDIDASKPFQKKPRNLKPPRWHKSSNMYMCVMSTQLGKPNETNTPKKKKKENYAQSAFIFVCLVVQTTVSAGSPSAMPDAPRSGLCSTSCSCRRALK